MLRDCLHSLIILQLITVQKITAVLNKNIDVKNQALQNDLHKQLHEQSKIISEQGKIAKLLEHLEYYQLIPQQTEYDAIEDLVTSKVLSTSPPRLAISPSSVDDSEYSTVSFSTQAASPLNIDMHQCHSPNGVCFSDSSTEDILPSKSLKSSISENTERFVTAGREEIPLKTDSLKEYHQPSTVLVQPSTKLVLET